MIAKLLILHSPATRLTLLNIKQVKHSSFFVFTSRLVLWLFTFIILLFSFVWLTSDYFIRLEIAHQLTPYDLAIKNQGEISFNPFIGKLSVKGVSLHSNVSNVEQLNIGLFQVDVNLISLLSRNVAFDALILDGIKVKVKQQKNGPLVIVGIAIKPDIADNKNKPDEIIEKVESDKPWVIDLARSEIKNIEVDFDDGLIEHQIVLENISVERSSLSSISQLISTELSGTINNAVLNTHLVADIKDGLGSVKANMHLSEFTFEKLSHFLPVNVTKLGGTTELGIQVSVNIEQPATKISIEELELNTSMLLLDLGVLHSKLDALTVSGSNISITIPKDSIDNTADASLDVSAQLNIAADKFVAYNHENGQELLALEKLSTSPMSLKYLPNKVQLDVNQVMFEGLTVAKSSADAEQDLTLLNLRHIGLKEVKFSPQKISLAEVNIGGMESNIVLDSERNLMNGPTFPLFANESPDSLKDKSQAEGRTENVEKDNIESKFIFDIGRIALEEPAKVYYRDNSFKTRFERHIEVSTLSIENLSNTSVDNEASFNVLANIQHHSNLALSGKIKPFTQKHNLSIKAQLNELSLPNISAYMGSTIGLEFLSGQLDSNIDVTIVDDELSGETKLHVRGLTLSGTDDGELSMLKSGSSISLNTALHMLKDSNDNLELDIPLSGDISSPEFGWGSFLSIVTQKAVMSASEAYLIQTFVPYANIISIARVAGQFVLKVNIEDLLYQAKQVELQEEQSAFVTELVQILEDKKEVQLKTCPIAALSEVDTNGSEYIQALNDIAEERGRLFKRWLVDEKNIESKRILVCSPGIDRSKNGKPRIEFSVESMM